MKRLLQFGLATLVFALLLPLNEAFDTWDEPGFSNDTEYPFFAFVFAICLVLLVCILIAAGVLKVCLVSLRAILSAETGIPGEDDYTFIFAIPPLLQVPLRI